MKRRNASATTSPHEEAPAVSRGRFGVRRRTDGRRTVQSPSCVRYDDLRPCTPGPSRQTRLPRRSSRPASSPVRTYRGRPSLIRLRTDSARLTQSNGHATNRGERSQTTRTMSAPTLSTAPRSPRPGHWSTGPGGPTNSTMSCGLTNSSPTHEPFSHCPCRSACRPTERGRRHPIDPHPRLVPQAASSV